MLQREPIGVTGAYRSGNLLVAVMIACVATCYGFGLGLFPQIIPDMRRDLSFDYGFVGIVTGLVQLSTIAFAALGTWLVHRIGAGPTVVASVLLCGLCLSGIPLTGERHAVAILLMVAGGAGASTFVPMIELASRVVSAGQRGFAMSVISSAPAYGVLINSALVSTFSGHGRWQLVWSITGMSTLALAVVTFLLFRAAGLLDRTAPAETHVRTTGSPAVPRSIMPWVMLIFALGFINGMMPYPYVTYLSPLLREELGYSVGFASTLWAVIGAVGIGAGFVVGMVSSRFGPRSAMLVCYLACLAAGTLMAADPSWVSVIVSGAFFSLGFYPIYGLLPVYVSHRALPRVAVTALGICTVLQGIGGSSGNFFGGVIKTSTQSFTGIYVAVAIMAAMAIALTLLLPRDSKAEAQ